jgi:hypothetical protein
MPTFKNATSSSLRFIKNSAIILLPALVTLISFLSTFGEGKSYLLALLKDHTDILSYAASFSIGFFVLSVTLLYCNGVNKMANNMKPLLSYYKKNTSRKAEYLYRIHCAGIRKVRSSTVTFFYILMVTLLFIMFNYVNLASSQNSQDILNYRIDSAKTSINKLEHTMKENESLHEDRMNALFKVIDNNKTEIALLKDKVNELDSNKPSTNKQEVSAK